MRKIVDKVNNMIKYAVMASDFLLLNCILLLGYYVLSGRIEALSNGGGSFRTLFVAGNFSMLIAQYFFSTIIHQRRITVMEIIPHTIKLVLICSLSMLVMLKFLSYPGPVLRMVIVFGLVHTILQILMRIVERWMLNRLRANGRNAHYVILVGDDPAILMVYNQIMKDPATGYKVSGYFADNRLENEPEKLKHLGTISDLINGITNVEDLPKSNDIFCSLSHTRDEEILKIMDYCDNHVIRFFYVPRMVGNFHLNLKMDRLGDILLFTNHREPLTIMSNRCIKRAFDIVFSSVVLICLLPFFPIIALIIKMQSPGPIFFRQERTGLNGKNFMIYKFRTMHVNKDADLVQATKDDPRKYPFGEFMRHTNIDELPQFLNVFFGDMSVVGPRPHMQHHTEMYSKLINKYMARHLAKPGITGWAQVTGWRGETDTLDKMEGRVKADIWYIENWSFLLDMKIIMMTVRNVLKGEDEAY